MNMLKGLDHIGIRVSDFNGAISFYEQFGFEVIRKDFRERVIVLLHRSGVLLNLLDSAVRLYRSRNILMDDPIKYTGFTHIAFRVTDIDQVMRHVKVLGIDITEGPVIFGDGKTSIFIRDPDRNVIEFTQLSLEHKKQKDLKGRLKQEIAG
jgi:lactoylglutathione lyase